MLKNLTFNTMPLIVHAQGPHDNKPYWKPIRDVFFSSPKRKIGLPKDLTIFTWNNGHTAMGVFEKSMEHLGIPCMVLGHGIKNWENSKHKPILTYEALKDIKTEYIMGVDSRDAILIGDPKLIMKKFINDFKSDLIFSADLMNWPNIPEFKKFEDKCAESFNSDYKYLNSGAFIGKRDFCLEFFKVASQTKPSPKAPKADQGIFKRLFMDYYPKVQLDYKCQLFQNIGFVFRKTLEITETNE
jgi:hypothetical protein